MKEKIFKHRRFIQTAVGLALLIAEKVFDADTVRFWFDPNVVDLVTNLIWMSLAGSVAVEFAHDQRLKELQTDLGVKPDAFVGVKTLSAGKSGGTKRG